MTDRQVGLPDHHAVSAAEMLVRSYPKGTLQPLPEPYQPRVVAPGTVGIAERTPLTFDVIGDHGPIKGHAANAVSYAMQRAGVPTFVWSVGDVVYYHGDPANYIPQFYEVFGHLGCPIVAIPGNHDGDVAQDDSGAATGRAPLDTFMGNFCAASPAPPPGDPELEYGRHTQTQPSHDWGLAFDAVTILGVYSNVPSGGHLYSQRTDWLTGAMRDAPANRPLILSLHHPPLSVDAHHGGSQKMIDALTTAFRAAGRYPHLIETGHVHDYQRFTWTLDAHKIVVVVQGNSGYPNLHQLAGDATPGMDVLGDGSVIFEYGDASAYGYHSLSVSDGKITGRYTQVTPGSMLDGQDAQVTNADQFTIGG